MTQFCRTQCILQIRSLHIFFYTSHLLFFVSSIFICDKLRYPTHWASPVPRPVAIIRFGNAEDKLMLISMRMHAPTHKCIAACTSTEHFGLCKSVSHASFEMYRMRIGIEEGFCRDKQSSDGGHGELMKLYTTQRRPPNLCCTSADISHWMCLITL